MESLKLFETPEFGKIRIVIHDGEPWFVAKDIATAIGYDRSNVHKMCKMCRERDILVENAVKFDSYKCYESAQDSVTSTNGKTTLINEPGLYRILCRSSLPKCEPFEAWVFDEVLPSIRKSGGYATPSYMIEDPEKRALAWAEEHKQARLALEAKDKEIDTLKAQNGVLSQDYVSNKDVCLQLLARGLAKKKNGQDYALSTLLSKVSPLLQRISRENGYSVSEQIVVVDGVERKTPYYHVDVRDMVIDLFAEKNKEA